MRRAPCISLRFGLKCNTMIIISRHIDQWLVIGDDIQVSPTDIDEKIVRLIARGRMLGGAEDGGVFQAVHEMSVGQSFAIGPMIRISIVEIRGGQEVRLGVTCPPHLGVRGKESNQWLTNRDE